MPIAVSVHDLGVYMGWYGGVSYLGSFASPLMLLGMGFVLAYRFANTMKRAEGFNAELTGEVLRVLRELADRKTTMIIVTHEMHFARDVADRILFMDGGVVVEEGPAKQLIDHPREQRTKQFLAHYAE